MRWHVYCNASLETNSGRFVVSKLSCFTLYSFKTSNRIANSWSQLDDVMHCLGNRLRGATVARLTPDQKVACSNHVGVIRVILRTIENIELPLEHQLTDYEKAREGGYAIWKKRRFRRILFMQKWRESHLQIELEKFTIMRKQFLWQLNTLIVKYSISYGYDVCRIFM